MLKSLESFLHFLLYYTIQVSILSSRCSNHFAANNALTDGGTEACVNVVFLKQIDPSPIVVEDETVVYLLGYNGEILQEDAPSCCFWRTKQMEEEQLRS